MFFMRYYGNFSQILLLFVPLDLILLLLCLFACFWSASSFHFTDNVCVCVRNWMKSDKTRTKWIYIYIYMAMLLLKEWRENNTQNIASNAIYKLLQNNIFHFRYALSLSVSLSTPLCSDLTFFAVAVFLCKYCTFIWWCWFQIGTSNTLSRHITSVDDSSLSICPHFYVYIFVCLLVCVLNGMRIYIIHIPSLILVATTKHYSIHNTYIHIHT